jgi:endonuclease III
MLCGSCLLFGIGSSALRSSIHTASGVVWQQQWQLMEQYRQATLSAPVDSMGAAALSRHGAGTTIVNATLAAHDHSENARSFRFQTLLATMLSPQTKDNQTAQAFLNIQEALSPVSLTAMNLQRHLTIAQLESLINMVSFYKTKAKHIYHAAELCTTKYEDDLPSEIDDLFRIPGVGPKIGYLTFSIAWGQTLGICVDTHVHRIAKRLGWTTNDCKSPEDTRRQLERWLPREKWAAVNGLLVGFGQTVCTAQRPHCVSCPLRWSCPSFSTTTTTGNSNNDNNRSAN